MLQFLALAAALAQTTHTVNVGPNLTNRFSPQDITIQLGDSVQWVWQSGLHNVDSKDGYFISGSPVTPPNTYTLLFDAAFLVGAPISGNHYAYQCDIHGGFGMVGSVTVLTPGKPVLVTNDPVPGGSVQFSISGATPGGTVIIGYSSAGPGPLTTAFGLASMSPPITQLPPVSADALGAASLTLPVPPSIPPGFTAWTQALDLAAGVMTNGARVIV